MYDYGFWQPDPLQQLANRLQSELIGLFQVSQVIPQRNRDAISFNGRLLMRSENSYAEIERRFHAHGYTPILRHENGQDVLVALPGTAQESSTGNPLVNLLLFVATIFTTLTAGAALAGVNLVAAFQTGSPAIILESLLAGAPFALTLLGILGIHELGHYLAARWHRVKATLPYFIPLPFGGLGTLGAFIALRSPMKNRKVLFDVGLAGPIAGFLVALPLLVVGLLASSVVPAGGGALSLDGLGSSLLVTAVVRLLTDIPAGATLALSPIFFAAWLGLYLTGINLLPVGQLDGGHIAYALLGRRAHLIAQFFFLLLVAAGFLVSSHWLVWALFLVFGGIRHAPPLDDISELAGWRKAAGVAAMIIFILVIVPIPFG